MPTFASTPHPAKPWTLRALASLSIATLMVYASPGASPVQAGPGSYEKHGPIDVSPASRRIARATHAPDASVHRRPPPRATATRDHEELQALTAQLDLTRGEAATPQLAPQGLRMPDLPIAWNEKSSAYLRHYTGTTVGRTRMLAWLERLVLYGPTLERILLSHGVPKDLIYVAMVESGIHGGRRSTVGASGVWQFMPSTGTSYGLKQSSWVDDRNHVIKSTHAAALFLSDLHSRFGNWELALASYNAGYGLVSQAMKRHNTNNFWSLRNIESGLPVATANYTPKVLALAVIGNNMKSLEFAPRAKEAWDLIEIPAPPRRRLSDLARQTGVELDTLKELNAHLVRGVTPPRSIPTTLVIPRSWKPRFEQPQRRASAPPHLHRLRSGESIQDIAKSIGRSVQEILALNGRLPSSAYRSGDQLILPTPVDLAAPPRFAKQGIAVPPICPKPDHQMLLVRVHTHTGAQELERTFHTSWAQIVADNELDPTARFFEGQTLVIQVPTDKIPPRDEALYLALQDSQIPLYLRGSQRYIASELASRGLIRRAYRVSGTETLESIAARYGSSAGSLGRINGMHPQARLRKGQQLIVYTPRSRTRGTFAAPPPAKLPGQARSFRP